VPRPAPRLEARCRLATDERHEFDDASVIRASAHPQFEAFEVSGSGALEGPT